MIQELFKTISSMPGPRFLVYYGIFFVLLFVLEWIALRLLDSTRNLDSLEVPDDKPDPYEIAALRGGSNEIIRLFLFELFSNRLLELTKGWFGRITKRSKIVRSQKPMQEVAELSPEGKTFLDWFNTPREAKSVFTESPLKSLADERRCQYDERFHSEQLIRSGWEKCSDRFVRGLMISLFLGVGCFKFFTALGMGRTNVAFLYIGALVGAAVLAHLCPFNRLSNRGRRYIEDLQRKFYPDKKEAKKAIEDGKSSPELVSVMGLMGIPILAGTDFAFFSKKFDPVQSAAGCGGGCGGFGCGGWSGCGGCGLG